MLENGSGSKIDIEQRLQAVTARVRQAEKDSGRPPQSVQILPVSKKRSASEIEEVFHQGYSAFAESYLQEAQGKIEQLAELGLEWHFIGPIQSNKTQLIAQHFDWVHSVARLKIAQRLNDQRPQAFAPLNVCVQVNISGEISKSGIMLDELPGLIEKMLNMPRLTLRGLMTIPASTDDFQQQRAAFGRLREAFNSLKVTFKEGGNGSQVQWDTLSMGMSNDLDAAIMEGATIVRVGSDIFGARE